MRQARVAGLVVIAAAFACTDSTSAPPRLKVIDAAGRLQPATSQAQKLGEKAAKLIAEHLQLPRTQVNVDTVRILTWPDSSLGCPKKGRLYRQASTPGHKITLRVGDALHFVHEAQGRTIVCERPSDDPQGGVAVAQDQPWAHAAAQARTNLATHLHVDPGLIDIASARPHTWPDVTLGCPETDQRSPPQPTPGYVLTLRFGGRAFTYHTDLTRVMACPRITED